MEHYPRKVCLSAVGAAPTAVVAAFAVASALLGCSRSPETPKTLARAGKDAVLLGASDGRVFWVRGNRVSWWDAAFGDAAYLDIEGAHWASRSSVVVDSTGLLFVHHNRLEHLKTPQQGSKVFRRTRIAGEHANGVVREGDCAYVLDGDVECRGDGAVLGIALVDGVHCPNLPVPANGLQPLAFAGDARHFFWSDTHCGERRASPTGIFRVDRATGISTLVVPNEVASELEVGKRGLYWRGRFGVRKALASEPGSVPVLAHTAHSLVVAGGTIYYAADDGIHWVSEEGGLDRLIPDGCGSIMTALDGSNVDHLTSLSRGRSRGSGLGTSPSA